MDFDPGSTSYIVTISPGASQDGFICKLNADGNFIWVKTFGQNGTNNHFLNPTGLDIDQMNNIITTGFFIGNYDFDPGPGTQIIYSNPHDCYILKLDQQGDFVWAKIIGNNESDAGYDVAVDADNNVYTIGSFGTSVDFDPGPGEHIINSPYYGTSALLKLSSNGDFIYAAPFQSLNYGGSQFSRMELDHDRNIYITGSVSGENDFDPGPGVHSFSGTSNSSPFVIKLSRCLNVTRSTLNVSACNSYTLNNETYNASGTYHKTIPNAGGCDSIITLNLVINKKLTIKTKTICEGDFYYAAGLYQTTSGTYYDTLLTALGCDSVIQTLLTVNPKPLPNLGVDKSLCKNTSLTLSPGTFVSYLWQDNSTAATFTAGTAGLYWVQVTNNYNCMARDTFRVTSVLEPPSAFLKSLDSLCERDKLIITPELDFKEYLWSTGSQQRTITVEKTGPYSLTVGDENGCIGKETILVFEKKECIKAIYIPSAFTPNNDGVNDLFKATVFGNLISFKLDIYNQWGKLIFSTTDFRKGWDGSFKGMPTDSGAFVWICSYEPEDGKPTFQKGTVTLIR